MLLNDVFERFVQDSPVSVMVRGLLENTLSPRFLDELFANAAELQYTRTLLFSSVVDLMGLVVNRIQPAVNSAYHARAKTIGVSLKSVYNKLDNLETGISAAMVGTTAERLETVVTTMGGALPPLLPGYRIKILDGNHLAATEHRIKELRTIRAGALPGQALVVLDPSLMLVTDVVLCEDGHAQERSLLDQILEIVRAKDVWIDDRNFCTTGFLFGIARREAFFVVRQHAATLHWEFTGKKRACGRIETGKVFEQTVRLTNPDTGEILFARRITVVLDKPTRDGDGEIHILTNLPKKAARAKTVADLYRKRWTIETAFQELEATLDGEINTLGYPKAALFAFCVALVSYNLMSVIKAALRTVHGEQVVEEEVSGYHLANEVTRTHDGMMIAIPEDEWVVFHELTPAEMGKVLVGLARNVELERYPKQPHGPKRPKPEKQSGAKIKHVATAKILKARHSAQNDTFRRLGGCNPPQSQAGSWVAPTQPFEGDRMSVLSCRFPRSYQLCREATLMLLNDVFERFVHDSPVSVMVRGLLENTLSPRFLDELFANAAEPQYTRTLLFSSVVDLMGLVVNRIQPAVNSAYHARAKTIGVSLKSVYNK